MISSRIRMDSVTGVLLFAAVTVGVPGIATADEEPQESNYISEVTPTLTPQFKTAEGEATIFAGIDQCESLIDNNPSFRTTFRFNQNSSALANSELFDVFSYEVERGANRRSCTAEADCEEISDDDTSLENLVLEVEVPFRDLVGTSSTDICEQGTLDNSYYVQLKFPDNATTDGSRAESRVILDLIRPDAPATIDAIATEFSISVDFERSMSEDAVSHHVVYSRESFAGGVVPDVASNNTPLRLETTTDFGQVNVDLNGGETLWVAVAARDEAGNFSVVSDPLEVTAMNTVNFWDYYQEAGGAEEGGYGCQNSGGDAPAGTLMWWLVALSMVGLWWKSQLRYSNWIAKGNRR